MGNISHANRFFYAKIPVFPFISIVLLFKYLSVKSETKRYVLGHSDLSVEERYEKFLSFYSRLLFFKNLSYTFTYKKKVPKIQTIFVVDESLNWDSIVLLRYVIREHYHLFPIFLLHNFDINKKPSMLWDLIDTCYGLNNVDKALRSKRSFFIERRVLKNEANVSQIIQDSRIDVIPVYREKKNKSILYRMGEPIKTTKLSTSRKGAINDYLDSEFSRLKVELEENIKKGREKRISLSRLLKG